MKPKDISGLIGQLLIVGFDGTELLPHTRSLLTRIQPAGVILFARNIVGMEQTYKLLKDCQACVSTPLFTCVDLEGGLVDRFRKVIGATPAPAEVFASGNRELFRQHGRIIGNACRAFGFNTDFAPVLDLAFPASSSVMSTRAVSDDPKQVVIHAREFLTGLHSAGVLGCGKHFPGLGEANLDTHHELPNVDKSWKKLWEQDIYPYRVMRRELPMILVGHAAYPAVTRERTPASLSKKWVTDVLRKKIGYRGLVVSDDLEMSGVLAAGPIEQVAVEHVRAGGDLCLICHQEEWIARAYEAMVHEVDRDRRFAQRVKDSAARISSLKKKSITFKRRVVSPAPNTAEKLSRQLWEFGEQVRLASLQREERA